MNPFVLQPFEHPGAETDFQAHARTRLAIGGKARNFVLKRRGDTLYFKEPSRSAVYACFDSVNSNLASDAEALVQLWKHEIERDNFGAFITQRDYFPGLAVRGQLLFLVCGDGRAKTREHFDSQWFDLPAQNTPFDVFDSKSAEKAVATLLKAAQTLVLDRTISDEVRSLDPPRFVGPDAPNAELLLRALSAFQQPGPYTASIALKGHSAFAKGEVEGWPRFCAPSLRRAFDLLLERNTFVGVQWSEGREEKQRFPRKELKRTIKAGLDKWGREWRGNWAPQRARLDIAFRADLSAHERVEAALLLREWTQDKLAPHERDELLRTIAQ